MYNLVQIIPCNIWKIIGKQYISDLHQNSGCTDKNENNALINLCVHLIEITDRIVALTEFEGRHFLTVLARSLYDKSPYQALHIFCASLKVTRECNKIMEVIFSLSDAC